MLHTLWNTPLTADAGFALPNYQAPFGQVYWPYNHNPYTQQFTLDMQYSLRPKLLAEIGYVGSLGRRQPTQLLINAANQPAVAGDSCNSLLDRSSVTGSNASCATDPGFQPIDERETWSNLPSTLYANANVLNSSYNSLQAQLIQRPVRGLQYHLNYTYSATLDESSGINNISGEGNGLIQDPQNPGADYGPAGSDQKHRFVATYSYELGSTARSADISTRPSLRRPRWAATAPAAKARSGRLSLRTSTLPPARFSGLPSSRTYSFASRHSTLPPPGTPTQAVSFPTMQ